MTNKAARLSANYTGICIGGPKAGQVLSSRSAIICCPIASKLNAKLMNEALPEPSPAPAYDVAEYKYIEFTHDGIKHSMFVMENLDPMAELLAEYYLGQRK